MFSTLPEGPDLFSVPPPIAPAMMSPYFNDFSWDWMLSLSGQLMLQFRRLGMPCMGRPASTEGFGLLVDDSAGLTKLAAAHVWMMGWAQRSAMEMCQLELLDQPRPMNHPQLTEITTVAMLAGTTNPRSSAERLHHALARVAVALAEECQRRGVNARLVASKPESSVSPMTKQHAVPFAACRLQGVNMSAADLVDLARTALKNAGDNGAPVTSELLVLSNIWLPE